MSPPHPLLQAFNVLAEAAASPQREIRTSESRLHLLLTEPWTPIVYKIELTWVSN